MTAKLTIDELNRMAADRFAAALGHIFEHAPWVAERASERRPFASRDDLHRAMMDAVHAASEAEQLALLRGHPELAGKAAAEGSLTSDSATEQNGAGLGQLTPGELAQFRALNAAYTARFGFPFIMAVKGRAKHDILAAFERRVKEDRAAELNTALGQVAKIAAFRLADAVET